ncbi:tryptophan 2,3-dioxygenase [Aquimarina sp. MMG015]|uniref:tryptophan 2,3-dioxygenase family protein n=1 Tax=Aquimarina TaxID=290174 RepID=UPI00041115DB|nr:MULTISPECIES: tryptophan 2,3-dioxygenase family protein [Aquimarina]AXT57085.1 tryptophan 2,3-dioxygenase [Aquimarina sp. AD1]MBQ4801646.1 tryptophan 2,3-dioxygenase [Aquimarina sp. MMG015]RKN35068.1 tryptophan 2,3-dioxygenase [Aquimarina sp. AD1]
MDQSIKPEIAEKILQLEKKFKNSGQDLGSYLDGLLHDKYLTYWDYIHLDTLLSLQIPRTHFPDEEIFIMYHQITELYFKLIIHELKQIIDDKLQNAEFFTKKLDRINRYFRVLINSFDVMIKGMDRDQFLKYRMSLLPASGFQSVQFRMIEIYATPLVNLVNAKERDQFSEQDSLEEVYEHLYWKSGATDIKTGEKTLTLKQFEYRYTPRMMRIANQVKQSTIYHKYLELPEKEQNNVQLINAMRTFDTNVNINWLLMHMGAAYRYLNKDKGEVLATGGTNWKKFLPPSFQRIMFFPNLWSAEEQENWGQQWVTHQFNTTK